MNRYYLRIEGVNFDSFVLDTDQLKVIRGGSLMLLDSVKWLEAWLEKRVKGLRLITSGASWGLFAFEAKGDPAASGMLDDVRRHFKLDPHYRHATMTFALLPAGKADDYPGTRARLETLSRFQQMQSPSVAIPSRPERDQEAVAQGVCEYDKVRPATRIVSRKHEKETERKKKVSASVQARWKEDGQKRTAFYHQRTDLELEFVEEFHALAENEAFGLLHKKMAVIYLDGNHFGKKAAQYCTTESRQEQFDLKLREEYQNGILKSLLQEIDEDPGWKHEGAIRLATLLWGGDEIIWVVPAWRGWWMLGRFFELSREWKIEGQRLTHGAGIVFCHYDAPIQPLCRLARGLGDLAKGDRKSNRLAYQILESFDHTGTELQAVRDRRWPLSDKGPLIVNADAMRGADVALRDIKSGDLSKRQLYRLAQNAFRDIGQAEEIAGELKEQVGKEPLQGLEECFGPGLPAWLHLLELWDYLGLEDGGGWR